jgi:hypothetical protein
MNHDSVQWRTKDEGYYDTIHNTHGADTRSRRRLTCIVCSDEAMSHSDMSARNRLCGRRRRKLKSSLLCALSVYGIWSLWYWNQQAIWQQREAPLDHILAVLQAPFYALSCPAIPEDTVIAIDNRTMIGMHSPTFAMISARPPAQVQPVFQSWNKHVPNINLVSTINISRSYRNTRCQKHTWASQLFAVYQDVFSRLLEEYPEQQHFVTVEDDTVLLNATRLLQELDWAVRHSVGYYSFMSSSSSCVYKYGTTAQLISRRLMEAVLTADTDSFCRLPIDMFIARAGPWYVTTKRITKHIGKRLRIQKNPSTESRGS